MADEKDFNTQPTIEALNREAPPGLKPDAQPELIRRLHELRAEVQDLQSVLGTVRAGQASLKIYTDVIFKTREDIAPILKKLDDPVYPDLIRHVLNAWERVLACPVMINPDISYEAQELMGYLEMLDEQFNRIIYLVGQRTIPVRVNDWLHRSRPGYYLPFNLVFESELPSPDDRQKVLNFLAWAPQAVENGIVDPNQGLIYRYNRERRARLRSMWLVILMFLVFTGLVIAACTVGTMLPTGGWPLSPANLGLLTGSWVAVLVGVAIHLAVASVKRTRQNPGLPAVLAIDDLPLVVDARKSQIILKLFLAFVGLFFMVFATGVEKMSLLSAFLVGYSLDSFIEMFGASLELQSQALAGNIKQQMGL